MADNSAGEVFIELGLDISKMESDFVHVDETISQNLSRLNRESNLIQLRADVDIGNLDSVNDAEKILELRTQALNQQLEIQRDRIKLVEAAYQELVNAKGADAAVTQKMEARLERERLGLQRVEGKLRDVAKAQQDLNNAGNTANNTGGKNPLLSIYDNFKGDILGKLGDLGGGFESLGKVAGLADGAITKVLTTIGRIPAPAGAAIAALVAIPTAVKAAEDAILSIAEPAITAGDVFYVASRGAQMTIKDFEELSTICKVTGIELGEVTNVMKRLDMQLVKSADGKVAETLKKYGVEVRNVNGELKNALDMSIALAEGLGKAQAEGKGKDFIAATLGKGASGDIVTYLEDLSDNIKAAKEIVRNGLFDPVRAHNIQGEINKMNTQAEQLGSAFSSAFYPVVEILVPKLRERMGDLTQVIQDNANGIKNIGYAVAKVVGHVGDLTTKIIELGTTGLAAIGNTYAAETDAQIKKYREMAKIRTETEFLQKELLKESPVMRESLKNNSAYLAKIRDEWKKAKQFREETEAELRHANTKELKRHEKDIQKAAKETEESLEKTKNYLNEISKIKIDLQFGRGESYNKSLAQLDLWYQKELEQVEKSEKAKVQLDELNKLKREELERNFNEKIKKYTQDTADMQYAATHSAYEKEIYDISKWKQKALAELGEFNDAIKDKNKYLQESATITAQALSKEAQAYEKEMDRIRGKTQTLAEKIFEKTHSKQEIDIMRVQKEYAEMLKEGIYNPADLEFYRDVSIGDILANKDRDYRRRPKLNLATVDTDYYANLQAAIDNVINSYKYLSPQDKIDNRLPNIPDLPDINFQINKAVSDFDNGMGTATDSASLFATAITDSANKINDLHFNQPPLNIPNDKDFSPPELPNKNKINDVKAAPIVPDKDSIPKNFNIDSVIKALSEVTQAFQKFAQDLSNVQTAPPPVINVSPNININLGGAYVFDNEMKDRLTNDIATDVANEITTAVQRATNNLNFARRG